ncbi:hypothetical protein [Burkholderia pseudomultivorans]|uniref:hypothetical protein n=1 Tax=Burkholderia pseudomultivorans TaxID=1207504 RepID=UPI0012D95AAC|nr:hypothetical protein [Burkholderia pseudomultivorans]
MKRGSQAKLARVNQPQHHPPRHHILILIVEQPDNRGVTLTQQSSLTGRFGLIVARYRHARVNQRSASINIGIVISAATSST